MKYSAMNNEMMIRINRKNDEFATISGKINTMKDKPVGEWDREELAKLEAKMRQCAVEIRAMKEIIVPVMKLQGYKVVHKYGYILEEIDEEF